MNINEIKELIELINSSDLAYFEYECEDSRIKMDKSLTRGLVQDKEVIKEEATKKIPSIENTKKEIIKEETIREEVKCDNKEEKEDLENVTIITSPMVGTFYGAPSPDSYSFVSIGEKVNAGSVLCIIEAMKLMNEIESEVNGTVVDILIKDGEMVEYGTPLFKIKEGN
ncbi:acetyl-CoA carboxylase, biotin carboxyl carrier protein [Clostridium baratii]|uniref:acetyl-CoA carboxylase biotin carboxyl carrier protein n=1 Tax=Clostridium baratii TaxID=1561 RepID=UPI0009A3A839|nr:acetyl-CoA carboxylase biotin carboxyl carrier protein [Clostridium baratii]OPF51479.1 acetyl-CoA carboxylase, biotin carboxyl carrier protein [Clostridium baratii]OPF55450.1 acetyl-CoA carboxylase, biotin carboxyl carrier protein [Clostridium baratii]OPF57733.1 acetyl-CoA carboxylase, biotin carboxyl carrier protein [Clostridium baratii]OPF60169.1 acetyl-CoA carboxylase, biotin carboxyl carrier protein [Clostridium baratii]